MCYNNTIGYVKILKLHHVVEHITTRSYFIWHYSVEKVSFIYFWSGAWLCNVTIQQLNSNLTPHFEILTFLFN